MKLNLQAFQDSVDMINGKNNLTVEQIAKNHGMTPEQLRANNRDIGELLKQKLGHSGDCD